MIEPTVIHVESLAALGDHGEPIVMFGTITGDIPRGGMSFKTERRIANLPVEIHIDEATRRALETQMGIAAQALSRLASAQYMGIGMQLSKPIFPYIPYTPYVPPLHPSDCTDQALASFLASDSTAFRLLRDPAALNALWDAANVPRPPRYVGPRRAARRRHHRRLKRR